MQAREVAVVVGGGPVGLTAALIMERKGFAVTLLERQTLQDAQRFRKQTVGLEPSSVDFLETILTGQRLEFCSRSIFEF